MCEGPDPYPQHCPQIICTIVSNIVLSRIILTSSEPHRKKPKSCMISLRSSGCFVTPHVRNYMTTKISTVQTDEYERAVSTAVSNSTYLYEMNTRNLWPPISDITP